MTRHDFLDKNCLNSISLLIDWRVYYTSPNVDLGPSVEGKCWDWEKLLKKNASWWWWGNYEEDDDAIMMIMRMECFGAIDLVSTKDNLVPTKTWREHSGQLKWSVPESQRAQASEVCSKQGWKDPRAEGSKLPTDATARPVDNSTLKILSGQFVRNFFWILSKEEFATCLQWWEGWSQNRFCVTSWHLVLWDHVKGG